MSEKHVLAQLGLVVFDDGVGRLHDVLGGAVVLLQLEDLQLRVVALEIEDVGDVGAAEGVDALGVVAHHADVALLGRQLAGDEVLRVVGVLVLVHHHEPEQVLVLVQHVGMVPEQHVGLEQQVVEVHRAGPEAALLVLLVEHPDCGAQRRLVVALMAGVVEVLLHRNQLVLRRRNAAQHQAGLVELVVEVQLFQNLAHQGFGVLGVVDGEVARVAELVGLGAQDFGKHRVEGAHPQVAGVGPTTFSMRARISLAALLVKVSDRMLNGSTPFSSKWAMR